MDERLISLCLFFAPSCCRPPSCWCSLSPCLPWVRASGCRATWPLRLPWV